MCYGKTSPDKDGKEMCMCVFVYRFHTKRRIPICIELCEDKSDGLFEG